MGLEAKLGYFRVQMTKLLEKLEIVSEERKQKERMLLKLYEEEGKTMDSSDEEEDLNDVAKP